MASARILAWGLLGVCRKPPVVRYLASMRLVGPTAWYRKTRCRNSAFRPPPSHPSSDEHLVLRYLCPLAPEPTRFTARYLNICATTSSTPTTSFQIKQDCRSRRNGSTISAAWSAAQSLKTRPSSLPPTKGSACGCRTHHSQLCPQLPIARLRLRRFRPFWTPILFPTRDSLVSTPVIQTAPHLMPGAFG